MCAMALTHSRIRNLVFSLPDKQHGAVQSSMQLQALASLNHHLHVFHVPYLAEDDSTVAGRHGLPS